MYFDGINLTEGSVINNLTVVSGPNFPSTPQKGELFYRIGSDEGLYIYNGNEWSNFAVKSMIGSIGQVPFIVRYPTAAAPNGFALSSLPAGFLKNSGPGGNLSSVSSIDLSSNAVSGILSPSKLPALIGEVTSSTGSNVTSLLPTGVTPGTYNKVTVDAKGRVISAANVTTLAGLGITDAAAAGGSPTQNFMAQNLTLYGDLIPATDITSNLGSSQYRWKSLFINEILAGDVKLSNQSKIYIGSFPFIFTQNGVLVLKGAMHQDMRVQVEGAGTLSLNSEFNVDINSQSLNVLSPTTTLNDLTINGNLFVNGTSTTVNSTTVSTKDNIVVLNQGEPGNGVTSNYSGLEIDRGSLPSYKILFSESDQAIVAGIDGEYDRIIQESYADSRYAAASHIGQSSNLAHPDATATSSGFMSALDRIKLDNIEPFANNYSHPTFDVGVGTFTKVTVNSEGHVEGTDFLVEADIPPLSWSKIEINKPTTINGYGITDAYTKSEVDLFNLTQSNALDAAVDSINSHIANNVVGFPPADLSTIEEIANSIGNDPAFSSTMQIELDAKLPLSEVVVTAEANKVLRTNNDGILETNISGNSTAAARLLVPRTFALNGDAIGSVVFDGTNDAEITLTLVNSGASRGTFTKVTVDEKGRVTLGTTLAASDIPPLPWSKIEINKPTTLVGYGITDAYSKTDIDSMIIDGGTF